MINIDELKKKIIYRSNYRGTKEMDKLLGTFVKTYIDNLNEKDLINLEKLLDIDDTNLYNFYNDLKTDFEIEIDPDAIYTLMIADDGTRATIFHVVLNCAGKGNLWTSTSGTQTFILVGDQIFENWFTAPPKRLILEDSIALLLSLDGTQCAFSDKELATSLVASCHALVRWRPEAKTFYGFGNPLEMNWILSPN